MRAQGTRTSLPVWPPLQAFAAVLGGDWYPSRGWSGPRRGDGDGDGDVDEDGDGDVDRDEDGDRGCGHVAATVIAGCKGRRGFCGNTAGFWRWYG